MLQLPLSPSPTLLLVLLLPILLFSVALLLLLLLLLFSIALLLLLLPLLLSLLQLLLLLLPPAPVPTTPSLVNSRACVLLLLSPFQLSPKPLLKPSRTPAAVVASIRSACTHKHISQVYGASSAYYSAFIQMIDCLHAQCLHTNTTHHMPARIHNISHACAHTQHITCLHTNTTHHMPATNTTHHMPARIHNISHACFCH
jgi:hypothetical protein